MMTKGERDEMLKLVRKRESVLKAHAEQRSAEMLAEFERQISAIYEFDTDETWKRIAEDAKAFYKTANDAVRARARELGIPDEFAPSLTIGWDTRGQNAMAMRRSELRRVAKAEIEAVERRARTEIERLSLEAQSTILSSGLTSDAAKAFFATLPTVEKLMPTLNFATVESKVIQNKKKLENYQ